MYFFMKRIFLFSLFFCCLLTTSVFTLMGETIANKSFDTEREIDLSGNLSPVKQRSLSLVQPIQAFIINQSIEVDFNASVGVIDLSIYDETGNAVYQQTVNASAGQQLFIDISSFDAGEYTIAFVNAQTDLSGVFEI